MNKEIISDNQGTTMTILFIFGSTLVMGTGGSAKTDRWLAIILAILLSIPVVLMYGRILHTYPERDLYDILQLVFGKITGKLLCLIFVWFSFYLGALVLRNFGEFMSTVGLPETPEIVPITIFSLTCALGVKKGIETIGKCSSYFIIIVISLLVIFTLFTIPNMKFENLLPIADNGIKPILQGAFEAFTFPFGELVVLLSVFGSLSTPKSAGKVYLKALLIGGLFVASTGMRNTMVMGDALANVYFPSYTVISRVNIGNFLQRLEISVIIVFILSGYIKISICMLSAAKGLGKLFGFKDYRFLVLPAALLMVNTANLLFESTMEMFEWAQAIWPYYAFPFQVIIPFIIFIAVELKSKLHKKINQTK
jgi:spore germination protein KB